MKVCVIGSGQWGKNHARTLNDCGYLGGIIDTNKETLKELKQQYPSIKTFSSLEMPGALEFDAYTVVVPAELHYPIAKTLLENNKHVLVEKPITLNSKDAKELCIIADKNSCVLMTGHLLLFHPAIVKIKSLIDSGKIGKLQYIYSNRLNLGTVRKEENSLWSFAPHDISIFKYFTNNSPIKVESSGGAFLQSHIHDTTMTTLQYPENIVGHIFVSWLHPFKEHRLVVIGSKGMLSYEDSSKNKELLFYEKGIDWIQGEPIKRDGPTETIPYEKSQALENELRHFVHCILGQEQNNLINGYNGLDVLNVLEQAEQSLQQSISEEKNKTAYFAHPSSHISSSAKIGKQSKIWNNSNIQDNAQIGDHCILGQNVNIGPNVKTGNHCKIQNNVSVYEGVELEDYVFCGPSMVFTNITNPRCLYQRLNQNFIKNTR